MYRVGNGKSIAWKMRDSEWKVRSFSFRHSTASLPRAQAYMDATQIGTFYPLAPRRLVLEAPAHKYIDHMLIAVLLFMREKDDAASARADSYGAAVQLHPFC